MSRYTSWYYGGDVQDFCAGAGVYGDELYKVGRAEDDAI